MHTAGFGQSVRNLLYLQRLPKDGSAQGRGHGQCVLTKEAMIDWCKHLATRGVATVWSLSHEVVYS